MYLIIAHGYDGAGSQKRNERQAETHMIEYITYRHAYGKGFVNVEPSAHAYNIPQHWLIPTRQAFEIASY
jgi:hypothetical protein